MTTVQKTARFWVWWNGFVRITVSAGKPVVLSSYASNEEGFERCEVHFTLDEATGVLRKTHRQARDCDGPRETFEYRRAALDRLKSDSTGDAGVLVPDWQMAKGFIDRFGALLDWESRPVTQ